MLIEDINRPLTPKEAAYRLQQLVSTMSARKALQSFIEGNSYTVISSRQITRPVNGIGKSTIRNIPKAMREPESVFNEIGKYANQTFDIDFNKSLPVKKSVDGDVIVLYPDAVSRLLLPEHIMETLYRKNIEQTNRLIEKLLKSHNRMKVAELVSKIDIFGSSQDRVKLSKDLTQIIVAVNQICSEDDIDIVIKHYIKPMERNIQAMCNKLVSSTEETDDVMYLLCDEVILIDTKDIDIDSLREELAQRY